MGLNGSPRLLKTIRMTDPEAAGGMLSLSVLSLQQEETVAGIVVVEVWTLTVYPFEMEEGYPDPPVKVINPPSTDPLVLLIVPGAHFTASCSGFESPMLFLTRTS